ncbi:hypothetical protein AHiyo4_09160 [Arthrobacter sp. Hiyo4]|nr:hypothetical protein AHiyo4_09160 [Arthrobacter sp. Hiyo4]
MGRLAVAVMRGLLVGPAARALGALFCCVFGPAAGPATWSAAAEFGGRGKAFRARLGAGGGWRGGLERSVRVRVKQHIHGAYKSRRWG